MHSPESIAFSEGSWLRSLVGGGRRPNLLVLCQGATAAVVARRVSGLCSKSLEICLVPGELRLPQRRIGTLLLYDVSALTLSQQITLYDWMNDTSRGVQVISMTSAPLMPLVNSGLFLEGLYYRLNVVYLMEALENLG